MLATWARGTEGNFFPLCRNTVFYLTSKDDKQVLPSWIVLVSKSLHNRADIISKQCIFLREKFFEFILAIARETHLSNSFYYFPECCNLSEDIQQ
jgi:hypothetical protein